MAKNSPLNLTADQIRYFRARRGHLAGPGAASATEAAHAVLGVQAQQLDPALLALSQRTEGRPSAAELTEQLFAEEPRALVRTWGQRDTVHIYDAAQHWARIVAARQQWAPPARRGPMPTEAVLDATLEAIKGRGPVTRKDVYDVTPESYADEVSEQSKMARQTPIHFAAGRLLWKLAHRGDVVQGEKRGSEQLYATRQSWFPHLEWVDLDATQAGADLTRDYLAVNGPATATDVGHFFGARVTAAKAWLKVLQENDELIDVACEDRKGLLSLAVDRDALAETPPKGDDATAWPIRLLPKFDTLLMAHKDKTWTVPEEADAKQIWRKAANVMATVLVRGRLVAVWTMKARKRDITLTVEPLSAWKNGFLKGVKQEAKQIAQHLGRESATVEFAS